MSLLQTSGQGDVTSADFQNMTSLPEELEKAMLDMPMAVLLKECKWSGASSKYSCVRELAKSRTEAEIKKLLASKPTKAEIAALEESFTPPVQRREPVVSRTGAVKEMLKEPRAAQAKVYDDTVITLGKGTTTITPGSQRAQVIGRLSDMPKQSCTMKELAAALPEIDIKAVLGKLREKGWVK